MKEVKKVQLLSMTIVQNNLIQTHVNEKINPENIPHGVYF